MTPPVYDDKSPVYQVIKDILCWIEHDLSRSLRLGNVAARAGYSKWHLQRAFRQLTGYRLASYIRMRRLTTAAGLLKTTSLQVSDIYLRVGYDEGSVFCRAFYNHFGCSATEYRANCDPFKVKLIDPLMLR